MVLPRPQKEAVGGLESCEDPALSPWRVRPWDGAGREGRERGHRPRA